MRNVKKSGQDLGIVGYIIKILIENKNTLIISLIISLAVITFFYGIWVLPIISFGVSRMSEIVFGDYVFMFALSLLFAMFFTLYLYETKHKVKTTAASSIGALGGIAAGFFGAICPVCQGIVFLALGATLFSIPSGFITSYTNVFKLVSILFLSLAVLLKAQSIYTRHCVACKLLRGS